MASDEQLPQVQEEEKASQGLSPEKKSEDKEAKKTHKSKKSKKRKKVHQRKGVLVCDQRRKKMTVTKRIMHHGKQNGDQH
mmetsp:Transcript_10447/g.14314  ORF Transcript_10447/g.14314 Transcript_10447/m.14314 type:complete len:80 (+) Transcript_10447:32-271(+)